jgi:hypothetical protein
MVNSISQGQFLKNGYNRYFLISQMDADQTVLAEYNGHGPTGKCSVMSTATFHKLYRLKNFMAVRFFYSKVNQRWMEKTDEMVGIKSIGGTRFLVKPAKFQF